MDVSILLLIILLRRSAVSVFQLRSQLYKFPMRQVQLNKSGVSEKYKSS